jgi:hypothetical protein
MARLLGNPQQILWMFLLTLLTSVLAPAMHSQSSKADPDSEPKPEVKSQESAQPPVVDVNSENPPAASAEQLRQAEIEADTKKLYQLSAELRAEVGKTYKESLSLTVLKKAEEVEKLAKGLKILMMKEAASRQ